MTYQETIDYIFHALPMFQRVGGPAYKANLNNAYRLDKHLSSPHRQYKTIHVAGTNGKGSVSHILAAVLQSSGYKTGLYTSPHLLDFRERIKINGAMVSEEYVVKFTDKYKSYFEQIEPSFFEMTAFMAFSYFADEGVDIAVIEVGLGGRLDTTNIITPEISVITNIGMDHMQYLGNSIHEIAGEKAGIIKNNVPVLIGESQEEIRDVFETAASDKNCDIFYADQHFSLGYAMKSLDKTIMYKLTKSFHWKLDTLETDLLGNYQGANIITALMTLTLLDSGGLLIKKESISDGLKKVNEYTRLTGRWQEIGYNPLIVCDIAHNREGLEQVVGQIRNTPHKNLHMVLGFVSDKKLEEIVEILPSEASYYLCRPDIPRGMEVDDLSEKFRTMNYNYEVFESVSDAFTHAKEKSDQVDLIYIGGSTFVVSDFLKGKNSINNN